ncbi:MAG: CBS domain-containing protein [Acidilobaceae archaeon]|nr:CBS domain-containing protein [Acidilobaceae archaeon]MCX8165052.1 CBS domain-containing protein [Acidilobaceae archaeon]MDW7974431.1 CBS domain-containing protein [Sulfolobales archaeon]
MSYAAVKIVDVMKKPPITVQPTSSVLDAVKIMHKEGISSVIVTSPEGKVIGIFTERDVVRIIAEGKSLHTMIGEVMTKEPLTIHEGEPLSKAVILMTEKKIRHIPVVDEEGKVKGMLSVRDIAAAYKKYLEHLEEIGGE